MDRQPLDHQQIEDRQTVSLYLMGRLPAEERELFEEHMVECSQCLYELELAEGLRNGMRQAVPDWKSNSPLQAQGLFARLARLGVTQQAAVLIFAVLLVIAIPAAFIFHSASLRARLEAQEKEIVDLRNRYGAEIQARNDLQMQSVQRQSSQFAAPLYSLPLTRGSEAESTTRIAISPSSPTLIVLSLEMVPAPEFKSYGVQLMDQEGTVVWSVEKIDPPTGSLAVALRGSLLRPGRYRLKLNGLLGNGRSAPAGTYRFEVH
jgi:hypothetical protein